MAHPDRPPNRLAGATSPYLLQHAYNPVDWYPWGPEALARAAAEDRPLLLSVGYSACHWCHVMERESFEDPATAEIMNRHFVCVKVDREERPDIDSVYMDAVTAMTGQGGWPMTVFCTPDGKPFFAGTYFPPVDRHGLPAFPRLLETIAEAWRERRAELVRQGDRVVEALLKVSDYREGARPLSPDLLTAAYAGLERSHDPRWGGFGGAPKFPQPDNLELLLRCHARDLRAGKAAGGGAHPKALEMVVNTLDRMARGGIYDQVGGGFHRYSTDREWLVPHFEKMLYDNALLIRVYLHAYQLTGNPEYERVVRQTAEHLLRDLRHPQGGFFSALDADSEGEEGRYYVWTHREFIDAVTPIVGGAAAAVAAWFGVTPTGNWSELSGRDGRPVSVLWHPRPLAEVAQEHGLSEAELALHAERARQRLLEIRAGRVAPATDDKVLTFWNALAIQALTEAGRVLDPGLVEAAVAAAGFLRANLRDSEGRLLRSWREGRASGGAYLDDHAALGLACLTLHETTFESRWLSWARELADTILDRFVHPDGGFYDTAETAEPLVVRPRSLFDNAVPSGGSLAAELLLRLARLTGESRYEAAALASLERLADLIGRAPTGFGRALAAIDLHLGPTRELALVGDLDDSRLLELAQVAWTTYQPNLVIAAGAPEDPAAITLAPLLAGRGRVDGRPAAYVCERFACRLPVTGSEQLARELA